MAVAKRFSPLILFSDLQSSSSTIPGHAVQQQQQARHLRIPSSYEHDPLSERDRDSRRMLPSISSLHQQQTSLQTDMDMDMDIDAEDSSQTQCPAATSTLDKHSAPPSNDPQALEDYRNTTDITTQPTNAHTPAPESTSRQHSRHPSSSTNNNSDQKSSSPINMSTTTRHQDQSETSSSSLSSGAIVSPPSSYSSNASSAMDALAKTLSPARIDIHRKRIQRMLQQNSLLWWELVRYTRNLERSERELEREKEQEESPILAAASGTSTSVGTTKPRGLHHYHHHHHHHHHHPSLPPLHPQQQALSRTLVASSKGSSSSRSQSRSHPYDSTVHRDQNYSIHPRPRWHTAKIVDYRRPDQPNSSHMDQNDYTEEGAGAEARAMELGRERLPSKYSSASQSPSPVSTPPPSHTPMSKRYGEEPLQEESSSAFQYHREYYPHSRRHRQHQEGRSSYSAYPPHQQNHYQPHQRHRYDSEASSHRYPSHPSSALPPPPHSDCRYDSGSATPTTSTSKRLPPMDSNRIDAALNGALNAVHSSGPSSTASSPRSREFSSTSTVHQNPHHRGQSDLRYHSSYLTSSHHEPATPLANQQQQQPLSTSFGPRRTAPSPSEFPPHSHHDLHHHQHSQHYSHNPPQPLTSRPSGSPHPKIEPLPRPVPVKPPSFVSPSAMSSISPAPPQHHSMAPSTSAPSSPVARTTPPTAFAAAATTGGHHNHIRSTDPAAAAPTTSSTTHAGPSEGAPSSSTHADPNSNSNGNNVDPNRKRRGNLPKSVTSVLKSWLVQNAIHPYPTEEEKMRLSEATQLSMNQISNWFINARRRILQPILHEAAAAAVAGTDAPVENVLIVRKGKGSRMHVEMEGVVSGHPGGGPSSVHHQHHHLAGHNHHHNESESNEESVSLAPVKSASHSSSPQLQPHDQSQPQPILSS